MVKKIIVNCKNEKVTTKWLLPQVFSHAAMQITLDDATPALKVGDKIQITATVCVGKIEVWVMTNEDIE